MSTQPQVIPADAATLIHDLAKRHAHINYVVIGILVLVLSVGSFFGYRTLKKFEAQEQALLQQTNDYKKQRDDAVTTMNAHAADRADLTKQQETKVVVIHDRDTKTDAQIAKVTAPAPIQQVQQDSKAYLGALPAITPDNLLAFQPIAVQGFISTKLDRDRINANYLDLQAIYKDEQAKNLSLATDLATEHGLRLSAQDLMNKWEGLSHKTKWQKFGDAAVKVLEIGASGYLGYEAGKHGK